MGRASAPQRCIPPRPGAGTTSMTWWHRAAALSSRCSWAAPWRPCSRTPASGACTPRARICCRCANSERSCCGPSSVSCSPSPARASRRPMCSAPAATTPCAVTPTKAWGCPRGAPSSAGATWAWAVSSTSSGSSRIGAPRCSWTPATRWTTSRPSTSRSAMAWARAGAVPWARSTWTSPMASKVDAWRLHFSAGIVLR